ncbi:hypothetical protein NQ315_017535 [Exocentrus adspersus]|uniref:Uncharacterized protein n=1 Tax=Exocentrus adspersus TaxID=1586481 RepID=A0AAV8VJR3_9CUCU|nr:hypothetical protein NQ315_017535 [Exocentrus adspersus]
MATNSRIAEDFPEKWNFHFKGAVDGFHNMVLLAVVNANYEFKISEFGVNGIIFNGGVTEHAKFYNKLKNNVLQIPEMSHFSGSDKVFNYIFVGDE